MNSVIEFRDQDKEELITQCFTPCRTMMTPRAEKNTVDIKAKRMIRDSARNLI